MKIVENNHIVKNCTVLQTREQLVSFMLRHNVSQEV